MLEKRKGAVVRRGLKARSDGRIQPHGGSCFGTSCDPFFDLWVAPGDLFQTDFWYALAASEELALGTLWNGAAHEAGRYPQRFNARAAVSYVTGSHNIKVGFANTFSSFRRTRTANADLEQEYILGRSFAVVVYDTPVFINNTLTYNLGVFAQDQWALGRLTLNLGVRFDWAETEVSGTAIEVRQFVEATDFPTAPNCADQVENALCMPSFCDVAPRIGVAYDLRGDARVYNGFEVSISARLPGGGQLLGGWTMEDDGEGASAELRRDRRPEPDAVLRRAERGSRATAGSRRRAGLRRELPDGPGR